MADRLKLVPGTKYLALDGRELCLGAGCDGQVLVKHVTTSGEVVVVGIMTIEEFEDLILGPATQEK